MTMIPKGFPVRVLTTKLEKIQAMIPMTCGECGRSWDDHAVTAYTPVPSGRCPFEAFHEDAEEAADDDGWIEALAAIHPDLPAAIGHAMSYCIEDDSAPEWKVLVDPALAAAATAFYPIARELAKGRENVTPS